MKINIHSSVGSAIYDIYFTCLHIASPTKAFYIKTDHISEIQIGDHVNQPGNMSIRGNH